MEYFKKLWLLADWIYNSRSAVFFTGAGISTESGLADYRGPDGVWTRRDKGLPPPRSKPINQVRPNRAHYALVELQNRSLLAFLISQNVDNLHLRSGIDPDIIAELHGNHALMRCMGCDNQLSFRDAGWDKSRWGQGYRTQEPKKGQPKCSECSGRLMSSVVNFGDPLPEKEMSLAFHHSEICELFVVVGSSLVVTPAADIPAHALDNGAKLVMINHGDTPYDHQADLLFREDAGDVMEDVLVKIDTFGNV